MLTQQRNLIKICQKIASTQASLLTRCTNVRNHRIAAATPTKFLSTSSARPVKLVHDDGFASPRSKGETFSYEDSNDFDVDQSFDNQHQRRDFRYARGRHEEFSDLDEMESKRSSHGDRLLRSYGNKHNSKFTSSNDREDDHFQNNARRSNSRYVDFGRMNYGSGRRNRNMGNFNTDEGVDFQTFSRSHFRTAGSEGVSSMQDLYDKLSSKERKSYDCEPLEKNMYSEHSDVTNRSQDDIKKFFDQHEISVTGKHCKRPLFNFKEAGFSESIVSALQSLKFEEPSPIQCIGWPHALSGCDVVGIAQTGSGKTLSFMLPAIMHVIKRKEKHKKERGPFAVVVCPTRELAMQVNAAARPFSSACGIRSMVVYGGQSKLVQANKLSRSNVDILVATPGRLLDFLATDVVSLENCSYVVMDEADRMLDMGFEPQVRAIMEQTRPDRQVVMFSATWPMEIQDLAADFLTDYTHLKIGALNQQVNANIKHEFFLCDERAKFEMLANHLLDNADPKYPNKPAKTLVFCSTKFQCEKVSGMLRSKRIRSDAIHGNKSQNKRDETMHNFRKGFTPVLVASDVAARGIDVSDIQYVVNYDMPNNIDSYIHRVGRTARAGKEGTAINFVTIDDGVIIEPLRRMLLKNNQEVPEFFETLAHNKKYFKATRQGVRHRWSDRKPTNYTHF